MCFGKKDHYDPSAVAARPTNGPPQQPTYAPTPKKTEAYDAPSRPPPSHSQAPIAEMGGDEIRAPDGPPLGRTAQAAELYSPPAGPPPGVASRGVNGGREEEYAAPSGPPPGRAGLNTTEQYAAPSGPPPNRALASDNEKYDAPAGPPPGKKDNNPFHNDYTAPSGPPPNRTLPSDNPPDYAPPPGAPPPRDYTLPPTSPPPPGTIQPLKKQHTWEDAVPDTSLFPPPPDIFTSWESSPTNNATEAQAQAGTAWCAQHPPSPPLHLDADSLAALDAHVIRLMPPTGFRGTLEPVSDTNGPPTGGVWRGKTAKHAPDSCIIGFPPMYNPIAHSPLASGRQKTIYYEVKIRPDSRREETSLALGYASLPYPSFRLPGWHRGSLAVHGDDGHKYINDMWGGRSFTGPIKRGETVGIGMRFTGVEGKIAVNVFFTRDGRLDGEWDLHEETDADQELPVTGLEGFHDLSCAVGCFEMVSFDVVFEPERWLYRGAQV